MAGPARPHRSIRLLTKLFLPIFSEASEAVRILQDLTLSSPTVDFTFARFFGKPPPYEGAFLGGQVGGMDGVPGGNRTRDLRRERALSCH